MKCAEAGALALTTSQWALMAVEEEVDIAPKWPVDWCSSRSRRFPRSHRPSPPITIHPCTEAAVHHQRSGSALGPDHPNRRLWNAFSDFEGRGACGLEVWKFLEKEAFSFLISFTFLMYPFLSTSLPTYICFFKYFVLYANKSDVEINIYIFENKLILFLFVQCFHFIAIFFPFH